LRVQVRLATTAEWNRWLVDRTDRLTAAVERWYGGPVGARAEAVRELDSMATGGTLLALETGDRGEPAGFVGVTAAGQLDEVWIAEDRRGHGLGKAGRDAGLRWLTERGCVQAATTIDSADPASVALCRGWRLVSQRMERTLQEPPVLREGTSARPMTLAEFTPWLAGCVEAYADTMVEAGEHDEAGALVESTASHARLLPDGVKTSGSSLLVLESSGRRVGMVWVAHHKPGTRSFVYDVEIEPAERGRGHGRQAMLAAQRAALANDDRTIGLNVFSHDEVARGLYTSLGYRVADQSFALELR